MNIMKLVYIQTWFSQNKTKFLTNSLQIYDFWEISGFCDKNVRELGSQFPDFLHVWSQSHLWGFEPTMRQYAYEWICFRTTFSMTNISAPKDRTEMFGMDITFLEKQNHLKIQYLVAEIFSKTPHFLEHPVLCGIQECRRQEIDILYPHKWPLVKTIIRDMFTSFGNMLISSATEKCQLTNLGSLRLIFKLFGFSKNVAHTAWL